MQQLLGGFGSSGRWQVSLMGADMKSLDEGVTTLTVRLLPKAGICMVGLETQCPLAEFRRHVCVSDPASGPSKPLSACVSHAKEDARSNRGF